MSWIIPVSVIVVLVGLILDDLSLMTGWGQSGKSYEAMELFRRAREVQRRHD